MDHSRVDISHSAISCGVRQISRLSDDTKDNLFAIANSFYHPSRGNPPAFVIFSNLHEVDKENKVKYTNGHRLEDWIKECGLGHVMRTAPEINPSTSNPIVVWVWHINHQKLKEFYLRAKRERLGV